jgi:hypothetical protein
MMLDELSTLLAHLPEAATREDYVREVKEHNVLAKPTTKSRAITLRHLIELYGLDPTIPLFRVFRRLWEQHPIGWNLDLNDGVRHNKKPKLNITWDKDCGKDVESAPWFSVFKGERINDYHLTLAEKRTSRGNTAKQGNTP